MLELRILPGDYAICRLPAGSPLPPGLAGGATGVVSVTWAPDELSIVCRTEVAPAEAVTETVWRCFQAGPVELAQTGVMASLIAPLAEARVNIFAFSTHGADYLLVPAVRLSETVSALIAAGHRVDGA